MYSLFIIHYSLFIIHYSLFIIHYSLFIIHYSLFIIHYSLYLFIVYLFLRAEVYTQNSTFKNNKALFQRKRHPYFPNKQNGIKIISSKNVSHSFFLVFSSYHFVFRISYFVFRISYFVFCILYFVFRILYFVFSIKNVKLLQSKSHPFFLFPQNILQN